MLANLKSVLAKANKKNYAVGAFNINDLEILEAIISAAEKQKSPVIVQTTEGAIEYAGVEELCAMMRTAAKMAKVPVVIHLDHGKDLKLIKKCIDIGYTSVMFDGSHYDYETNVKLTKKVVGWAHKKGVSVEAELGTIGGAEDKVSSRQIILTDPKVAVDFVKRTGVDALAIAIGTSHGAYKFAGKAKLDIKRLKEIKKKLNMPLVLHGASGVPKEIVKKATKYGGKFGAMEGVPESQIKLAVKNGINKINTDTDLRLAFTAGVREVLSKEKGVFDPRKILGPAKVEIQKVVEHRMKLFGSSGKG